MPLKQHETKWQGNLPDVPDVRNAMLMSTFVQTGKLRFATQRQQTFGISIYHVPSKCQQSSVSLRQYHSGGGRQTYVASR